MGAFRSFFTPNEVIFEGERSEKRLGKRLYRVFICTTVKKFEAQVYIVFVYVHVVVESAILWLIIENKRFACLMGVASNI